MAPVCNYAAHARVVRPPTRLPSRWPDSRTDGDAMPSPLGMIIAKSGWVAVLQQMPLWRRPVLPPPLAFYLTNGVLSCCGRPRTAHLLIPSVATEIHDALLLPPRQPLPPPQPHDRRCQHTLGSAMPAACACMNAQASARFDAHKRTLLMPVAACSALSAPHLLTWHAHYAEVSAPP